MAQSKKELRVGAVGAKVVVKVVESGAVPSGFSGATTLRMVFEAPSGKLFERSAAFDSDGTDGKVKYTTTAGDEVLSESGTWKAEVWFTLSGFTGPSEPVEFKVADTLQTA